MNRPWWLNRDRLRALWNPARLGVDTPRNGQVYSAWLEVKGWATSLNGHAVRVHVDVNGRNLRTLIPSVNRLDVAFAYSDYHISPECGFETRIPRAEMPDTEECLLTISVLVDSRLRDRRVFTIFRHPEPLPVSPQRDYADVWDQAAPSDQIARMSVCCTDDEQEYVRSGKSSAETIRRVAEIGSSDEVLEIGCGTGRIGVHLAPYCRSWVGADVSAKMIEYAQQRLRDHPNATFKLLNGYDLGGLADESVDVVYCMAVLMHLDEWDRFRYISDSYRVLRASGRAYFDSFNLAGDEGWRIFEDLAKRDPARRPPNISKASTAEELQTYALRAGFADLKVYPGPLWVAVFGRKMRG